MTFEVIWGSIGPVIGAVVGYGATFVTESRADARSAKRASAERADAKSEKIENEMFTSEIASLTAAHQALADYAQEALLIGSETKTEGFEADLALRALNASTACSLITGDDLREACTKARRAIALGLTPRAWTWGEYTDAEERIGAAIRRLRASRGDHSVTTGVPST
jgi:hypothetical protein